MSSEVTKIPCEPMIGADVEAFLYSNEKTALVPCVGILPGTKEEPFPLPNLGAGYAVQEDNVMVEFNIPPKKTASQFCRAIKTAKRGVIDMLQEKYPGEYRMIFRSDAKFLQKELQSPQAKLIGCEPDFNAYEGGQMRRNPPPVGLYRGAGGHVHLGGDFQCPDFIAALFADLVIGVAGWTSEMTSKRAEWYGMPGVYRPKPYGIEYRSPDCMWAEESGSMDNVAHLAIGLSNWLTKKDAREIQTSFRAIDWNRVYQFNSHSVKITNRDSVRDQIIIEAQNAGLPV
jgi:hypothetical protein